MSTDFRARAALSAPEQGPTDEQIMELMPEQLREDLATVARLAAHGAGPDVGPGLFRVTLNTGIVEHCRRALARWGRPAVEPVPVADFDKLPDGFYWISSKDCPSDRSLVRLYTNPDTAQRGIGFGIWDGCAFVPLSDLAEQTVLTPALPLPQEGADG